MESLVVPVTDRAYAMSIENGTALNFCVITVNAYHQVDLFVKIELSQATDILVRDVGRPYETSLRASLRKYSIKYNYGTLSLTLPLL